MVFSLSLFVVTTLISQAVPPQTANGLRRSTELSAPREPVKALTPETRGDILMDLRKELSLTVVVFANVEIR